MRRLASIVLSLALFAVVPLAAQDYVLFESQYVKVLPGHASAMNEAMAAHNQAFHAEGPYTAGVYFIVNGTRSGQLSWVMGPTTWTAMDSRPAGEPHDPDWTDNVLAHGEAELTEYWILDPDLSYTPETTPETTQNLLMVRYFEVADNVLFVKVQRQIKEVRETMKNPRARTMYRKQFQSRDGRDWATVVPYGGWAELDEDSPGSFEDAFVETHGEAAWSTFLEEFNAAVVSRADEWRQLIPELSGAPSNQ
jgi:hypothetical protein